eukprot:1703891-Rhodomonas_salina.1
MGHSVAWRWARTAPLPSDLAYHTHSTLARTIARVRGVGYPCPREQRRGGALTPTPAPRPPALPSTLS